MRYISETLMRLKSGNLRFVNDDLENKNKDSHRRNKTVQGQNPYAIVLTCADSRVVPEHIFDTGLGELFVVGVAGNVANTSSIASIEYAVAHLGTKVIVVMGHQNCGAITAAAEGGDNGYNLNHLLSHVIPAISACGENADINDVAKKNAELTVKDIIDRSAIISEAINSGGLEIVAAYYQLDTGLVEFLD